jgi:hypothetical protein
MEKPEARYLRGVWGQLIEAEYRRQNAGDGKDLLRHGRGSNWKCKVYGVRSGHD